MAKRNLGALVKGAGDELEPQPVRRGRGLAGILTDDKQESTQAVNPTTQQESNTESKQERKSTIQRSVKSFRLRDDLIVEVDVLAARERRKIYEVIEEALELYLAARTEGK